MPSSCRVNRTFFNWLTKLNGCGLETQRLRLDSQTICPSNWRQLNGKQHSSKLLLKPDNSTLRYLTTVDTRTWFSGKMIITDEETICFFLITIFLDKMPFAIVLSDYSNRVICYLEIVPDHCQYLEICCPPNRNLINSN